MTYYIPLVQIINKQVSIGGIDSFYEPDGSIDIFADGTYSFDWTNAQDGDVYSVPFSLTVGGYGDNQDEADYSLPTENGNGSGFGETISGGGSFTEGDYTVTFTAFGITRTEQFAVRSPEPITLLGATTAVAFGVAFKRKKKA